MIPEDPVRKALRELSASSITGLVARQDSTTRLVEQVMGARKAYDDLTKTYPRFIEDAMAQRRAIQEFFTREPGLLETTRRRAEELSLMAFRIASVPSLTRRALRTSWPAHRPGLTLSTGRSGPAASSTTLSPIFWREGKRSPRRWSTS